MTAGQCRPRTGGRVRLCRGCQEITGTTLLLPDTRRGRGGAGRPGASREQRTDANCSQSWSTAATVLHAIKLMLSYFLPSSYNEQKNSIVNLHFLFCFIVTQYSEPNFLAQAQIKCSESRDIGNILKNLQFFSAIVITPPAAFRRKYFLTFYFISVGRRHYRPTIGGYEVRNCWRKL